MNRPRIEAPWELWNRQSSVDSRVQWVLEHLDWDSTDFLVPIDETDTLSLVAFFNQAAEDAANPEELQAVEKAFTCRELALGERVFEAHGQRHAAAALFALAHDQYLAAGDDPRIRFECLFLRFKLGHVMWPIGDIDHEITSDGIFFARNTLSLLERWRLDFEPQSARFLAHRLHRWIGNRWDSLEEYRHAEFHYGEAAREAVTVDERLRSSIRSAEAQAKGGDPQSAYQRLGLLEDELESCQDDETRQLWEAIYHSARFGLGGQLHGDEPSSLPAMAGVWQVMNHIIQDSKWKVVPEQLQGLIDMMQGELADTSADEVDYRHRTLVLMATLLPSVEPDALPVVERLLNEARALEDRVTQPAQVVERRRVEAQMAAARGQLGEARRHFAQALDDARQFLEVDRRLAFVGHYLEVLGQSQPLDPIEIFQRVDEVLQDFVILLAKQPGAPARRRQVEVNQQVFEAAIMALLVIDEQSTDESVSRRALSELWRVILSRRNVELHQPQASEAPQDVLRHQTELEDRVHAALRQQLASDSDDAALWQEALQDLYELELGVLTDIQSQEVPKPTFSDDTACLLFFKFRDLLPDQPLLILRRREGKLGTKMLAPTNTFEDDVKAWAAPFFPDAHRLARGVRRHPAAAHKAVTPPGFDRLLPLFLEPLPDLFAAWKRDPADALGALPRPPRRKPNPEIPWCILTDGDLSSMPLEMLPDEDSAELRFGEDRSVTYGLRNALPDRIHRPLDLQAGWLGLGGVPGSPAFRELPGSSQEVEMIQELLEEARIPAAAVVGQEARNDNLRMELERHKPAVLHLAVHGIADSEYPEACALILADPPIPPGQTEPPPERELLPFRHIAKLPLDGVELVVLSACSSLIGRSGRADTMQGLAWAFLRAGVPQVIASRYPVDDRATARLMLILYQQLLSGLPVGMALGKTRNICLRREGMDEQHVAAWSCWC